MALKTPQNKNVVGQVVRLVKRVPVIHSHTNLICGAVTTAECGNSWRQKLAQICSLPFDLSPAVVSPASGKFLFLRDLTRWSPERGCCLGKPVTVGQHVKVMLAKKIHKHYCSIPDPICQCMVKWLTLYSGTLFSTQPFLKCGGSTDRYTRGKMGTNSTLLDGWNPITWCLDGRSNCNIIYNK